MKFTTNIYVISIFLGAGILLSSSKYSDNLLKSTALAQTERSNHGGASLNLQQILIPFRERRCLIIVTSCRLVDIFNQVLPMLMRKLWPGPISDDGLLWYPKNVNRSFTNRFDDCVSQNFFDMRLNYAKQPLCTVIRINRFGLASPTWNCEVEVSLFLPRLDGPDTIHGEYLKYPTGFTDHEFGAAFAKAFILVQEFKSVGVVNYEVVCRRVSLRGKEFDVTIPPGIFLLALVKQYDVKDNQQDVESSFSFNYYDNCHWNGKNGCLALPNPNPIVAEQINRWDFRVEWALTV